MKKDSELLIKKALRSIKAAKKLYDDGDFDFAVARAYYAIFYVSQALLANVGMTYSKHAGVIMGVYEYFIKTEKLPKEFHKILHKAFDLRQQGDYLTTVEIEKSVANDIIEKIEKQVKNGIKILKGE